MVWVPKLQRSVLSKMNQSLTTLCQANVTLFYLLLIVRKCCVKYRDYPGQRLCQASSEVASVDTICRDSWTSFYLEGFFSFFSFSFFWCRPTRKGQCVVVVLFCFLKRCNCFLGVYCYSVSVWPSAHTLPCCNQNVLPLCNKST